MLFCFLSLTVHFRTGNLLRRREGAVGLLVVQLWAHHVHTGDRLSWDLLPLLGKKTILLVRVVRLWICASTILVSPPDPAAEVGGIYI